MLIFTRNFVSPAQKNIVLPKSDDETIGAQRGSTPWLTPGRREAGALLPACAWVVMDAALFNKPQGSGSRAPRKTPNGGGSKQPAPTAATSPNSRAARGSSSCERGAGTAESHLEERGPQPSMVPRQQLEATVSTLVKELYGCDGPQTFQLQKELWRMRREEEALQGKLVEERETTKHLRRAVESLHLGGGGGGKVDPPRRPMAGRGAMTPTRNQVARAEGAHTQRAEREQRHSALLHHPRGGGTVAVGGGGTHQRAASPSPTAHQRARTAPRATAGQGGRPRGSSWPPSDAREEEGPGGDAAAMQRLSAARVEAQRDGNLVENLLEQAMVGGEATLSAATAKLARDKLKSAEAQAEEARNETRGEVERLLLTLALPLNL